MATDYFKEMELDEEVEKTISACPVCASKASLWIHAEGPDDPAQKVVMCTRGEKIGPQDGPIAEGCPLYMPDDNFYRPRMCEAIEYWNEFSKALKLVRELNEAANGN